MGSRGQVDHAIETAKLLECWPSLKELKDIEFIRTSGVVNMFQAKAVMYELNEVGGYCGIQWLMRCKDMGFHPAKIYSHFMDQIVKEYGPLEDILSPEEKKAYNKHGLNKKRRELEAQLAALDEDLEDIDDEDDE